MKECQAVRYEHNTRFSDSSQFDEICIKCGEVDGPFIHNLNGSCEVPDKPVPLCKHCGKKHHRWDFHK